MSDQQRCDADTRNRESGRQSTLGTSVGLTRGKNTPGLEFSMGNTGEDITSLGTMFAKEGDRKGSHGFGD